MKKILYTIFLCAPAFFAQAQLTDLQKLADSHTPRFGVKVGTNWSYLSGSADGFTANNKTGFMVSAFYSPASHTGRGFRSELVFSRQGYSFDDGGKNTSVLNDYVYLPQLATFGIGKFFQLQAGAQVGFLLNSKMSGAKDSTTTGLMNRIDYGFAAGVELNPVKGVLIGGRYNLGLGKLYKQYEQGGSTTPMPFPLPFNPDKTDMKNGVVQLFIGYRF
ncbi:porin family protein [Flavisolibacter nicotianae]|uniref:porin family protein n=1 Tax=Flavisolibacter nicotianae TaxID=2364882 RepID=UPI0013C45BB5|nr:porin family protein [Flavisolibacter nicotianae]